jgi:nucleoside phosphorylase
MTAGPLLLACALSAERVALRPVARAVARADGAPGGDGPGPGPEVRLLCTGMGPQRSGRSVRAELTTRQLPYGALAFVGFGAAVRPGIRPGDVLVADEVEDADGTAGATSGVKSLVDALERAGCTVHTGPLYSADRVVRGDARSALSERGVLGVDMETAAALRAARNLRPELPVAALRVVVDTPERELLRPATLTGGLRAWRVLRRLGPALGAWYRDPHPLPSPLLERPS